MTFESRNGTYGATQPKASWLMRTANTFAMNRIRKRGGKFAGMNALVLTTVGKKSGEPRSTPVGWFPGGDGSWIIVASAAGAPKNPAWYYNLAANPDRVTVELAGRTVSVTPVELHGDERAAAWRGIVEAAPRFAQYETKTDRVMPVIRLVPNA